MKTIQAAIYARVSSERQATAQTIASQLAALRERVAADGCALPEVMQFLDDGYSGTTLVRPALERLRDLVAAGAVDRLYIHSPDRLVVHSINNCRVTQRKVRPGPYLEALDLLDFHSLSHRGLQDA